MLKVSRFQKPWLSLILEPEPQSGGYLDPRGQLRKDIYSITDTVFVARLLNTWVSGLSGIGAATLGAFTQAAQRPLESPYRQAKRLGSYHDIGLHMHGSWWYLEPLVKALYRCAFCSWVVSHKAPTELHRTQREDTALVSALWVEYRSYSPLNCPPGDGFREASGGELRRPRSV